MHSVTYLSPGTCPASTTAIARRLVRLFSIPFGLYYNIILNEKIGRIEFLSIECVEHCRFLRRRRFNRGDIFVYDLFCFKIIGY